MTLLMLPSKQNHACALYVSKRMVKLCYIYTILLSNKKEWTTDTHNNVAESQTHYAKSKNFDFKGYNDILQEAKL